LLPFRYPSGVQAKRTHLNGASKWPRAPNHPNRLESFQYPSGLTSLRSCIGSLVSRTHVNRTMAGRLTDLSTGRLTDVCYPSGILPVSSRRAGKVACPRMNVIWKTHFLCRGSVSSLTYIERYDLFTLSMRDAKCRNQFPANISQKSYKIAACYKIHSMWRQNGPHWPGFSGIKPCSAMEGFHDRQPKLYNINEHFRTLISLNRPSQLQYDRKSCFLQIIDASTIHKFVYWFSWISRPLQVFNWVVILI
jgi:hypothetical protein